MSLDLVFEILCEQMPSKMMDIALGYLKTTICSGFGKFGIVSSNSRTLVSANRICFDWTSQRNIARDHTVFSLGNMPSLFVRSQIIDIPNKQHTIGSTDTGTMVPL
ncbi:hypothetical protein ANAPRD1_01219 [Anaplasma phagocytophilum]|nr:hypothetical protein ANAPH1_00500 [Anaplasma phagocytophilum]SCV66702.1 hypothetical protein ANAPRD1_01219 [Anaplasma phagocytophilum]